MRTYRQIFAVPEFRMLFAARCTTITAVALSGLALGTATYDATGSTVLTALAMFGGPLITLIGSATLLGANDSLGPRRATMLMPLASAGCFALQAIPSLPWPIRFVLLAVPFLIGSATSGSTMRLLTLIVPSGGFVLGRATLNIAVGVTQVVGYALGGLLLSRFGPGTLFVMAAALAALTAALLKLGITERPVARPATEVLRRTRAVNRQLLGSPNIRPLFLAMWVPSGLVVGCEALFVPYAGASGAGYLFAVTAAGMLLGDVLIGRVVPQQHRNLLIGPLRVLLAAPYLGLALEPGLGFTLVLSFLASVGYAAALPLQERLVDRTDAAVRGQAFGLSSSGMMIGQAVGALLGGGLAVVLTPSHSIAVLAAASLVVTLLLTAPLRRSAPATR